MAGLSLTAIALGVLTGIIASAIAGLIFGIGFSIDAANRMREKGTDPLEEEADKLFDQAFGDASQKRGFAVQLVVISIGTAILSGAVTAWLAAQAPMANALVVGLIGTGISLASVPFTHGLPKPLALTGALVTLPATLIGAALLS